MHRSRNPWAQLKVTKHNKLGEGLLIWDCPSFSPPISRLSAMGGSLRDSLHSKPLTYNKDKALRSRHRIENRKRVAYSIVAFSNQGSWPEIQPLRKAQVTIAQQDNRPARQVVEASISGLRRCIPGLIGDSGQSSRVRICGTKRKCAKHICIERTSLGTLENPCEVLGGGLREEPLDVKLRDGLRNECTHS